MDNSYAAFAGGYVILWLAIYVYIALALQTIAKKTGTANGWMAWIPVLNFILMIQIASKPIWWIILILNTDTVGQPGCRHHYLDGHCPETRQAELVGYFTDCAGS